MPIVPTNPMRIPGRWRQGYALDYHTLWSQFIGHDEFGHSMFDTKRSDIGELLYRLKYRSDKTAIDSIIETVANFITSWNPGLTSIVPVPPSRRRVYQPVYDLAERLGGQLSIPLHRDCLVKIKDTPELKNVFSYEKRMALLEDVYMVASASMKGESVLLFDDLYRSGATLNVITNVLYTTGEAANVYALALTRTRSSS